ncbi:arylacetamide deacetylase-like 3 isoform X1 [Arapaima gigas]
MDLGVAILLIGFAAVFAAFLLLIIGLIYAEFMNSDIPPEVRYRGKLHLVHITLMGIAMVGQIMDRLGLCQQVVFTRRVTGWLLIHKRPAPPGLRIKDLKFGDVPVRAYEPTAPSTGRRRGLVYFHGGGWLMGSIDTYDEVCRHIAKESETVVVSVGYRLAPEHRYPAQLNDCEAATCHFLSVAEAEFGVDPRRVAVGGDSAGGNLAAALCLQLKQRDRGQLPLPCAQVLIYPPLQMANFNLPSYIQNQAVPFVFRPRAAFYFLQYLRGDASLCKALLDGAHVPPDLKVRYKRWLSPDNLPPEFISRSRSGMGQETAPHDGEVYHLTRVGLDPSVSPLLAEDEALRHVPPTFILTCEYDVLRDDGFLYRKRLQDVGVDVSLHHVPDSFHGIIRFINAGWLTFPNSKEVLNSVVDYVKTL